MNPHDHEIDIDQQIRINELRETVREMAGGEMTEWENPDTPPDLQEAFWGNVLAYESMPETCHANQLERIGIELPEPDSLDDTALTAKLWEVVHGLAQCKVYLSQTDHLSDRELYEHLWHDSLREITMDFPPDSGWNCHLDILGGCSEEDMQLQMKYYADEEERERCRNDWPDDPMPDHIDPPFDRDRTLPKSEN